MGNLELAVIRSNFYALSNDSTFESRLKIAWMSISLSHPQDLATELNCSVMTINRQFHAQTRSISTEVVFHGNYFLTTSLSEYQPVVCCCADRSVTHFLERIVTGDEKWVCYMTFIAENTNSIQVNNRFPALKQSHIQRR